MEYIHLNINPVVQGGRLQAARDCEAPQRRAGGSLLQRMARHRKILLAAIVIGVSGIAHANCWEAAGREFSISPELLYAIAEQESGLNPRAIGYNRDGSHDIGIMQINSKHLPSLAKRRITEKKLLANSCLSVKVGAGILADFMERYGYSWEAVGAYNAGTASSRGAQQRRMHYAKKISVRYQRLQRSQHLERLRGLPTPAAGGGEASQYRAMPVSIEKMQAFRRRQNLPGRL